MIHFLSRFQPFPKYDGLLLLEALGLKCPMWRFVDRGCQITGLPWAGSPHGWTLRCAPRNYYRFGMPSRHRLEFGDLPRAQSVMEASTDCDCFVVYPSWEFDISGCILLEEWKAVIEGITGDIQPLLRGSVPPMFSAESTGPYFSTLMKRTGALDDRFSQEIPNLLKSIRLLSRLNSPNLVAEWTRTTDGRTLFHDLFLVPPQPPIPN